MWGNGGEFCKFDKIYVMATTSFLVKSNRKNQPATIYIRFRHGREIDLSAPTELTVFPEYWSNKSQRFKAKIFYTDHFTESDKNGIEEKLRDLKNHIYKSFNETPDQISKDWLKKTVAKFHNKNARKDESLNEYIDRFINEIESGTRLFNHNNKIGRYRKGTIKNYKGFKSQFDEFQLAKKKQYNFKDIDLDFYSSFTSFLIQKNYSPNTIGRMIKNLKVIVRESRDEGLHSFTFIEQKDFKTIRNQTASVYLTQKEVDALYKLDLSNNPTYELARDVFLVGVYTAQRFSDYSRINSNLIKTLQGGGRVIDLIQTKTGIRVIIPIKPELESILAKYDYTLPKIYEQKLNERIKKIAKMAKINDPVTFENTRGGITAPTTKPKYELIKSHTARRTGCTLMHLAHIPSIDIMKISGHTSERIFLTYIKLNEEETAENLSSHPYFTGHLKKAN